jgi:hypothetical protein
MADHPSDHPSADTVGALFAYHPPTGAQPDHYGLIRERGKDLVAAILSRCPPCADTTAAVRKVREAVMTANAAIALEPRAIPRKPRVRQRRFEGF